MKTTRREFVQQALKATTLTALGTPLAFKALAEDRPTPAGAIDGSALQFSQVTLPYAYSALDHGDSLDQTPHCLYQKCKRSYRCRENYFRL